MSTPAGTGVACTSKRPGDFKYRACTAFCKPAPLQKTNYGPRPAHCGYCKCRDCAFCTSYAATATPPAADVAPPQPVAAPKKKKKPKTTAAAADAPAKPSMGSGATGSSATGSSATGSSGTSGAGSKLSPPVATPKPGASPAEGSSASVRQLQAALKAAQGRARAAEAHVASIEQQLLLCRRSANSLRQHQPRAAEAPRLRQRNATSRFASSVEREVAAVHCEESVEWALHVGVYEWPELYPGLNASSAAEDMQLHLHMYDPSSRCIDPRDSMPYPAPPNEGIASSLLLLGVLGCALCNAYSLGYLQPSRRLRSALRAIGVPMQPLVR